MEDLVGSVPKGVGPIQLLRSPYRTSQTWRVAFRRGSLATGSVALITLGWDAGADTPSDVREFFRRFIRAFPAVPVVGVVPKDTTGEWLSARLESRIGESGCGARLVLEAPFEVSVLRERLTCLRARAVHRWLELRTSPSNVTEIGTVFYLSSLFGAAPLSVDSESSIRGSTCRMRLPGPKRWRMVAKALPTALRLQRYGGSVETVAFQSGYSEPRAFRRHCRQLFDLPASAVTLYCGWEPLLDRFLGTGED